jgi:hypothetical protein
MVVMLAGPRCHTDLKALILAEYVEMPGLRLTLPQAARLWSIDRDTCHSVLASLVDTGFLYRSGDSYLRPACGPVPRRSRTPVESKSL